jgi:hypothetical protein
VPEQVSEALAAANAIGDDETRSQALAALTLHHAPEQVDEALAVAKAIGYEYDRSRALETRSGSEREGKLLLSACYTQSKTYALGIPLRVSCVRTAGISDRRADNQYAGIAG